MPSPAFLSTMEWRYDRQHHRAGAPAGSERRRRAKDQALGRSRGWLITKIHMLADALGRPLRLIITAGQRGDITQAQALLEGQTGNAVLAELLAAIGAALGQLRALPGLH